MATRELSAEIFGRETDFKYSESTVGYALLSLRVVLGWVFLYAGYQHVIEGAAFQGAVRGTLQGAATTAGNPFQPIWEAMLGYVGILTPLNAWGLFLVGAALILGVAVRWSAFWGAVMMLMYWGTSLPLKHGLIVDDHVVYALLLFGLGAFGAGRIAGIDRYVEQMEFVQRYPRLKYLLG